MNPFAPPETDPELSDALSGEIESRKPVSLGGISFRWLLVCSVSALPSFYMGAGISDGQIAAMVLGVLVFASGYTVLDYQTAHTRIRQYRLTRTTLRVVYVTRMLLTLLFPVGMFVDGLCGALSLGLAENLFGSLAVKTFSGAFLTTLTQGAILNFILALYGLLVVGVIMLFAPLVASIFGRSKD
ncbi:hypothetical protein N8510_02015 [bacterium]|nr:hypothetical protein [bacterium]